MKIQLHVKYFVVLFFLCLAFQLKAKNSMVEGTKSFDGKKYEDALLIFKEVSIVDPENAEALFFIARCYRELEQTDLSVDYITKAMKLDPKNTKYRAFAEILTETSPTPEPTPSTASKKERSVKKFQMGNLIVALAFTIAAPVTFVLGHVGLENNKGFQAAIYAASVAMEIGAIDAFCHLSAPVPIIKEKDDISLIKLKMDGFDLGLLQIACDPWNKSVDVGIAAVRF